MSSIDVRPAAPGGAFWSFSLLALTLLMVATAGLTAQTSPLPPAYQAHLKAAKDAARFDWTGVLARNCIEPRVGPAIGNYGSDPGREIWYAEPQKVFDNLYFLGTRFHTSWALATKDGIIVIDTLYRYASGPAIVEGLRKVGLDPGQVKYVLITHGHGDHVQGAALLQAGGARVVLSAPDWDLVDNAASMPGGKPKRDMVVGDGDRIELGGTVLTVVATPGHTAGTFGLIFPVSDRGRTVTVAYASGTAFSSYTRPWFDQFIDSQRKMAAAAAAAKATVLLSNHSAFDDAWAKSRLAAWRPVDTPNPFEVGAEAVQNYFTVLEECSRAQIALLP